MNVTTDDRLPRLQHFNEAIINHYLGQKSLKSIENPHTWTGAEEFVHCFRQKQDFKSGFLYVERGMLPLISNPELRDRLTAKHLKTCIDQVHIRVARTVLSEWKLMSVDEVESGVYSKYLLLLWEKNVTFATQLEDVLDETPKKAIRQWKIRNLFREHKLDIHAANWNLLIDLSEKNGFARRITVPSRHSDTRSAKILYRIAYAHAHNFLDPTLVHSVDNVCRVFFPDQVEQRMDQFLDEMVTKIKECDGTVEMVSSAAAYAKQQFHAIHPYPVRNSEVGTILMNLILVAFGFPSVVLRTHREHMDPDSHYNQILGKITRDPTHFIEFLRNKIEQNQRVPDIGTSESQPAHDDPTYLLGDALIDLIPDLRDKFKKCRTLGPDARRFCLNLYLKNKTNEIGRRFGFDMMYLPTFVDYTDEEKSTFQKCRHIRGADSSLLDGDGALK